MVHEQKETNKSGRKAVLDLLSTIIRGREQSDQFETVYN